MIGREIFARLQRQTRRWRLPRGVAVRRYGGGNPSNLWRRRVQNHGGSLTVSTTFRGCAKRSPTACMRCGPTASILSIPKLVRKAGRGAGACARSAGDGASSGGRGSIPRALACPDRRGPARGMALARGARGRSGAHRRRPTPRGDELFGARHGRRHRAHRLVVASGVGRFDERPVAVRPPAPRRGDFRNQCEEAMLLLSTRADTAPIRAESQRHRSRRQERQ